MTTLKYNPQTLTYEVPAKPEIDSYKTWMIQDINKIQTALTGMPVSMRQYDKFMRLTTYALETIILDQSAVLNRKRIDECNDGN